MTQELVKNPQFAKIPSTSNLWDGTWDEYYELDSCKHYMGKCIYGVPCGKCPLMKEKEE